jgi:hypothetical protein
MPEQEFAQKFVPIAYAQQTIADYELPPLLYHSDGVKKPNGEFVVEYAPAPWSTPKDYDNRQWRKNMAKTVLFAC